jgi:hypothetical protein
MGFLRSETGGNTQEIKRGLTMLRFINRISGYARKWSEYAESMEENGIFEI